MAGPLLVGAEGVLLVPDEESYASSRPIQEGIELVMQLKHFPTSHTLITAGVRDVGPLEHFTKVHGLTGVQLAGIYPEDQGLDPDLAQWYIVLRERSKGPINLVLTAYQGVYDRCRAARQPCLLFARLGALGSLPERADWDELHASVRRHRDAMAEDAL